MTVIPLKDYLFVQDFVKFIIDNRRVTWEETFPVREISESELTIALRRALTQFLERCVGDIETFFNNKYPNGTVDESDFNYLLCSYERGHRLETFNRQEFMRWCIFVAVLSALALKSGLTSAPHRTISVILNHIEYYRQRGQYPDTTWKEVPFNL